MHVTSNIMKSGDQYIFIRKHLQNTTFTVCNAVYTTIFTIRTTLVMYTVFSLRLRIAPLWVIMQQAVVISCRRCEITYQTLVDKTDRLNRNIGDKVPLLAE
jgi:hypothetical protein